MIPQDAALLASLPGYAFGFVLVLARVGGAVMLLPGIGESELPMTVRAGMALALTALVLPAVLPLLPAAPADPAAAAAMTGAEVVTGLWMGWLARLVVLALPMAGQIASYMTGLSNVLQPDPALGAQTSVLARLFGLAAPLLLLVSGLYAVPLAGLTHSFRLIPAGRLLPAGDTAETVVAAVGEAFTLAVRLAAPFILASIVWQIGTGLIARLVPRLRVYMAAMPGQILGGLLLFGALAGALAAIWLDAARGSLAHFPGAG